METMEMTSISSRGQVVIPQRVREEYFFKPGTRLRVIAGPDVIIFRKIEPAGRLELKSFVTEMRRKAKEKGFKKSDLQKMILKNRKSS